MHLISQDFGLRIIFENSFQTVYTIDNKNSNSRMVGFNRYSKLRYEGDSTMEERMKNKEDYRNKINEDIDWHKDFRNKLKKNKNTLDNIYSNIVAFGFRGKSNWNICNS